MNTESIPRRRDQWMYKIFGPTTIHLQHEFYLLLALTLLNISSLQALYKGSLGMRGDYQLILLSSLWLSRHLVLRWLCTNDTSTSRSPTLTGVLAHWITSHFMAGQYFDRPDPQVVARQLGTQNADEGRIATHGATSSSFFLPSILYTWHFFKVWVYYPTLQLQEGLCGVFMNSHHHHRSSSSARRTPRLGDANVSINNAYSTWNKFWSLYGPSVQLIIPVSTMAFYFWFLFFARSQNEVSHALTMNTRSPNNPNEPFDTKPYGAYQKVEKPLWTQVLFYLSSGGTLVSILLYGRVFLPIADLAAGGNVLKAVRNESKLYGTSSGGKSSKYKTQRDNMDLPWAENYRSIVGENRFRLLCKIAAVRLVESLFVCALIPRTGFSCRATGHCPEGASLLELSKIFFPVGITSALRTDGIYQNQFALITPDRGSALMTILSVIVITWSLLLCQAATLNRSYLGIMGYIAGEWTVVEGDTDPSLNNAAGGGGAATTPSQWDPRRRYKKGDLIVQNYPGFGVGQSIYKATSGSPEGRPFDLCLRATHDLFRNELGHPVTSNVIAFCSGIQLALVFLLILMIFGYQLLDYHLGSLLWTLAANLVAAYGTLGVTVPDYSEYHKLAQEISR